MRAIASRVLSHGGELKSTTRRTTEPVLKISAARSKRVTTATHGAQLISSNVEPSLGCKASSPSAKVSTSARRGAFVALAASATDETAAELLKRQ